MKKIDDEKIMIALLETGTQAAAARASGVSVDTIRARLHDPLFIDKLHKKQAALLEGATMRVNSRITAALDTITEICEDIENAPQVRLLAACKIIELAIKLNTFAKEYTEEAEEKSAQRFQKSLYTITN